MTPHPHNDPLPKKRVFVRAAILNMVAAGEIVIAMREGRTGWRQPTAWERAELLRPRGEPDVRAAPQS